MELKQLLVVLKRRLWEIILLIVAASTIAWGVSVYLLEPVYSASAELIVNKSSNDSGKENLSYDAVRTNIQLIETYKEIMKSRAVLEEVAAMQPDLGMTAKELAQEIKVSSVKDTQVMTVSMNDNSYDRASKIVSAVSKVFKSKISTIMEVDNVTILNLPQDEDSVPVFPRTKLIVAGAIILAAVIGIGMVALREWLDDTVKTERQLREQLGLQLLGSVTEMKRKPARTAVPIHIMEKAGKAHHAAQNQ